MTASIKLLTSQRPTKKGYPIIVELFFNTKLRKRKTIAHAHKEQWNDTNRTVFSAHPDYDKIMPKILVYKERIKNIDFDTIGFEAAKKLLFGKKRENPTYFYEAGLKLCDGSTNGGLYKTVLNSFNKFHPNVLINDITPDDATLYMRHELIKRRPNGVHTYMRTLNAIYGLLSKKENPFKGVRPKKTKTPKRDLTDNDLVSIITSRTMVSMYDGKNSNHTINHDRYYFMLMFYLGGLYLIDLANLRYDQHVFDDRLQFNRFKGGTDAYVNNKIFPEAKQILEYFKQHTNCHPYLTPIHKYNSYRDFVSNFSQRFPKKLMDLQLQKKPMARSARYTFINRAQQLLIDHRITSEIVGHEITNTHSIYTNQFPLSVRDEAHKRIITLPESTRKILTNKSNSTII